jgi:branched-chain amino acid transport system permease protein
VKTDWKRFDVPLVAAGFLLLLPLLKVQRTTDFIIFCVFVLSYDLLYGFMGRLSFGHMLFLGSGAYAVTLFADHLSPNPFLALSFAVAAAAAVGALIGPIIVRTTGAAFALINLAFNQIGYFLVLIAFSKHTGGEDGMSAHFGRIGFFDVLDRRVICAFALLCLLLVFYALKRLTSSPFGILLRSIKENETRARFLGYNTFAYKWAAFVISAGLAGFAGALSIMNYGYVTPSFIDPTRNVEVIFAVLIGGAGNLYGALVGGVAYMVISNYLATYIPRWEMFLGIGLLLLVFRFRTGVWGAVTGLLASGRREAGSR